uniref:MOR2-PAG1_N domain-containing protein n=1 Tax=Haemonchus contortus TaxID=6289 RepID=A0A7I4YEW8_HAECO
MTQRNRNGRRKSDPALPFRPTQEKLTVAADLPWGLPKVVPVVALDYNLPTGSFAGQSVLLDLFSLFERKLQSVIEEEPIEKLLNKSLQRGGDPYFDNLCHTLHGISELCLPSVVSALIGWHQRMELKINECMSPLNDNRVKLVKKLLAVNYLFCIVLIEILPQVEFHLTACEQQVKYLLDSSFQQVQYKDPALLGVNNTNSLVVAETYAEVIGVLSETHFTQIHKQFMSVLSELRKDTSTAVTHNLISLLMAMKFVKIKTNQVDDFEMGIKFLDDLGSFLLEVKDKDVKHAVAGLLVEILLPIAAQIKRETNIPALIAFVGKLYGPTSELASKKQHKLAAYPLLTCLLCVSQRQFFLTNWVPFLNNTLANLKNRDSRISRVALESLYRLLWVYMIRNNCDGNSATRSRLESICGSLFPKGNRGIVPRDAPLNIFVKIIHFIAQQKLDFAFKDVIFDLLGCNRSQRSLYPERMNIGIRALMVIADGLQQKDEPPAMPKSMGPSASGTMQRLKKKTYITRPLTVDIAKSIGLDQYYTPCRKAFDSILRVLDTQVGRPLMMTAIQRGKEPEELLGGDVKPKLDLFRTCVAAIPRLLPEPMTYTELIDILTRTTVHVDEELRTMAGNTLQNMLGEFPEWREQIIISEITLLHNQLTDFYPAVLDDALRLLHQMVVTWKSAALQEKKKEQEKDPSMFDNSHAVPPLYFLNYASVLHAVEGMALVMLCQIRPQPKKIAISILKEVKQIITILALDNADTPVITVLDEATPYVVRKYIEHIPLYERTSWNLDFSSVCDKVAAIDSDVCLVNSDKGNEYLQWDPWACALSGYAERKHLISRCPTAVASAWPTLFSRLMAVNAYVDPSNPQNENRASLLRGSKSKGSSVCGEALSQDGCLSLWQKYLVLCCAFSPSPHNHNSLISRSFSPTSSMETDVLRSVSSSLRSASRISSTATLAQLFTKTAAMLRWENMIDIRDSVVLGIGSLNAVAFETFLEDLNQRGILRDAMEKKMETNVRRRKRKDLLRLQIIRIIEIAVFRGLLDSTLIDMNGSLSPLILDFIDAMRANLESDLDRDIAVVTMMRLHFSKLIVVLIDNVSPENRGNLIPDEKKQSLFYLFIGWCSRTIAADKKCRENDVGSYVEQKAALAMTRLLSCGRIFETQKSIGEDGYLYGWLEKLVSSANTTMQGEVEEMLAWMLELNESSHLLDWLMSQCYSQPSIVAARCFRALVRVFSRRDFPCEFISLFVLCQAMLGDPAVTDAAVHMIEILKRQFLDNSLATPSQGVSANNNITVTPPVQLRPAIVPDTQSHCLPMDQQAVCQNLANSYPHLTITIFSEVSSRLEGARSQNRTYLISLLHAWVENIELVDPMAGEDACEGPRGWGSEEATQLLLNNLMYLTICLAPDHELELAELWRVLALSFPANLPVILNYLYVVTVLSHEALLPYAKRVSVILAGVVGNRIAALLLEQLSTSADSNRHTLERSDIPPYYRWKDDAETKKDSIVEIVSPVRDSPIGDRLASASEDASKEGVRLLPMPAYGGYYSRLCTYLPPTTQPVQFFTRSQVSLLLICDIIRASSDVDWTEATPRLLHAAVLSLDSLRPALCRHARQTIINISLLYADQATLAHVSGMLLKHQLGRSGSDDYELKTPAMSFCDVVAARGASPTFAKVAAEEYRSMLLNSNTLFSSQSDLIMALVFCLSENIDSPLWANEDATPRCWKVPSAAQLTCLVRHLAELVLPSIPLLPVVWTQLAMRMALTTSQRHAAGRCFQIVSSLCQPPGAWIPSLISRLVETAGETHEDTQAYVTDLLLCLLSSAPHLNPILEPPLLPSASPTHARSTSYTPALLRQSVINQRLHQERKDVRLSLLLSEEESRLGAALMRSKSADQLKSDAEGDEEATARMQICAIAVALLESGVDNEFLLSVNLLEKILDTSGPHKTRCLQKLEKTITQLDWKGFNSIVGLLSRGTIVNSAYEPSIQALIRIIDVLDEPVVGGRDSLGLVVCHVLPYLLFNFDAPNHLCLSVCAVLKQYCGEAVKNADGSQADHPLNNLATMLSQYSTKTFLKDRYQWAKCVLQYLCEAIDLTVVQQMIVLLAEMLEKGTASMHVYVLHMLYLLLLRRDAVTSPLVINAQVLRSVSRHVQGVNWREAARVYKVVVEQWQNAERENTASGDNSCGFEFELSLVSAGCGSGLSPPSPRKNISSAESNSTNTIGNVKKPVPSHVRVRDRLVGLLSASGLRVGLPSAVSVVFSQSELGSTATSTERICTSSQEVASTASLPDPCASITDSFPRVFKEFDFLEAEHDSVSETTDSCFGWLSTMRPRSIGGDDPVHDDDADADEDEDSESAQANSEGGGASTSRLSRTSASSDRTPCPSEVDEEENEGEDGFTHESPPTGVLPMQDRISPSSAVSREAVEKRTGDRLNGVDEESIDSSSFCCRSRTSVGEFYSTKTTPTTPVYIQCPHHLDGKVDATWISVVAELQDDSEGDLTAYATLLFTQLFRSCCGRVSSLLRDAMHIFSSRPLARTFAHAQDVLSEVADCPFLFVTAQYLRCSGILPRLKLSLFELREHWETFSERKEQNIRLLNSVKSAHKLNTLVGSPSAFTTNSEMELGKLLSKLFFQLMLMSDSLNDMVRLVNESHGAQAHTLSPAILDHQRELLLCMADLPPHDLQPSLRPEHSGDSLVLLMTNKRYGQALLALRQLRTAFGAEFGCCEASDIDVLLLMFCRSHSLKAWALVGAVPDALRRQSQSLRDANADVASAVRRLASDPAMSHRTSTASSLTESFQKISYLPD